MQRPEYQPAYHDAFPSLLPKDGWHRQEIHDPAELFELAEQLEADMRALGYPRRDTFAVALGLREAATNALQHGNRADATRSVLICCHVSPQEVLLEIADEGHGFDPLQVPNPLTDDRYRDRLVGRGLFLMRVYMSWIRFNKRGNRVILCKRRSGDEIRQGEARSC
jgi:anti-sigma regulatory factor (Ser/Thr protein kinase)